MDYVSRLVDRALAATTPPEPGRFVRPIIAPRFARDTDLEQVQELDLVTEVPVAPAPLPAQRGQEAAPPIPRAPMRIHQASTEGAVSRTRGPGERSDAAVASPEGGGSPRRATARPGAVGGTQATTPSADAGFGALPPSRPCGPTSPFGGGAGDGPESWELRPADPASYPVLPEPRSSEPRVAPGPLYIERARDLTERPASPRPGTAEAEADGRGPAPARQIAPPPVEEVVQVRIGRVEVHAPAQPPAPKGPPVSLTDYLRRSAGGPR